ncbi:CNP [Branchiostoma lanceolatum]|uniref:2',3'-cyclic-nucleotide 3'-phosphodiesterase n=2 Tax=Branchiostoma lanceolatum TaxID=7740 RepID=A0A8K0EE51_BRALA|nr:CNP [Branchiostoma lanceolatum]
MGIDWVSLFFCYFSGILLSRDFIVMPGRKKKAHEARLRRKGFIPVRLKVKKKIAVPKATRMASISKMESLEEAQPGSLDEFPFLSDPKTMEYVEGSRTMFIMRGLPGCGKSSLAKQIADAYGNTVVCSADSFRYVNGVYVFDRNKLQESHEKCRELARLSADSSINVLIVDNTNIRVWEFKYYLEIARRRQYTVVLVEPRTPWKWDVRELGKKNSHDVPERKIREMAGRYEIAVPLYFGWFLNGDDSARVLTVGEQVLKQLGEVREFAEEFKCYSESGTGYLDLTKYFTREAFTGNKNSIHCTAMFTKYGKVPGSEAYTTSEMVVNSCGQVFRIEIVGFLITPRTFGARVRLTEYQKKLWGQDDYETVNHGTPVRGVRSRNISGESEGWDGGLPSSPSLSNRFAGLGIEEEIFDEGAADNLANSATEHESEETERDYKFCPTWGFGRRAHITLGCAPGIPPVQTGLDLIEVVSTEAMTSDLSGMESTHESAASDLESVTSELSLISDPGTFSIKKGEARCYGDGRWVVYLDKSIHVDAMFSGFY